jgi:hypothetical protein
MPELRTIDPSDVPAAYERDGFADLSDEQLADLVAAAVAHPKVDPPTSFVLHAPLEVLARRALLTAVSPGARTIVRQRLLWVGATYAAAGDEVPPIAGAPVVDLAATVAALTAAVDAGEVEEADGMVTGLLAAEQPTTLVRVLARLVLPRLSAAGHGNILLLLLARAAPTSRPSADALRGLVRAIAGSPDWTLTWQSGTRGAGSTGDAAALEGALLAPPSPGDPGSNFIHPTMSLVEGSGLAAELLDDPTRGLGVDAARRTLLRTAAQSMLYDDPDQAPYGWSHCLTLPQAALAMAPAVPADDAVAVAATYVLGFRATLSTRAIDPHHVPERVAGDPVAALAGTPSVAAGAAWHAGDAEIGRVVTALADRAAAHPDAHLAKYTLACFDAAAADPEARPLFLAAAAFLGAWWDAVPVDDPLLG